MLKLINKKQPINKYVEAEEQNYNGLGKISWRLLTTHAVNCFEGAMNVIEYYRKRWYTEQMWYFWLLRVKSGSKTNDWLKKFKYGGGNIPAYVDSFTRNKNGIDSFWVVSGKLHITPAQQLDFIQRLYYGQLPFSKIILIS